MIDDLSDQVLKTTERIGSFISNRLLANNGFESRSFYAETFSLALLAKTQQLTPTLKNILENKFNEIDKSSKEFHWEFNRYALHEYQEATGDSTFSKFVKKGKFRDIGVTNWVLLRSDVLLKMNRKNPTALIEAKKIISKMQCRNGLIKDEKHTTSFQYHCFSLAMLAELWDLTSDPFFKKAFMKGIDFIRTFILSNGDTLYVGRGQQQLFGYASLLYALSKALAITNDTSLWNDINKVFGFILKKQRPDGSFPLVLRTGESKIPDVVNLYDESCLGWYSYNNYFDYLAFAGFFFYKTCETLTGVEGKVTDSHVKEEYQSAYSDTQFRKITKKAYEAVITKLGGYYTNDLAFPYIVYKDKAITPCYGGEQFAESLYDKNDLPLPLFPGFNRTLRAKSVSWLGNNRLSIVSPLGLMKRDYTFDEREVTTETRVWSPYNYVHQYLFYDDIVEIDSGTLAGDGYRIQSSKPLTFLRFAYSATSRLKVYGANGSKMKITLRLCE